MLDPLIRVPAACGLVLFLVIGASFGQDRNKQPIACNQFALAALKPMPQLSYPCDGHPNDWDEAILKLPARRTSINALISQLSSLSDVAWWQADTTSLSLCDFIKEARRLTPDELRSFINDEYSFWLFGSNRTRLVLIPDPCYQTQYGGANAFLLHRNGGQIFVTQVLDGYFSRADNSVDILIANLDQQEVIEISTGTGGLNPTLTNYYFVIDPRTNQAVPKNLFKRGGGVTNKISSAWSFSGGIQPLRIVRGYTLAKSFSIYVDDPRGKIDENGRTLSRKIIRWDGNLYR